MKVLIVEDQESLARLVKKGLEAEGFATDYLTDGEAGMSRICMCHTDYDLVLLDIMLPKKSGIEICQEMRKSKISTPVIILTAKDSPSDVVLGLNVGADDYLVKPFTLEVLVARIRAILRRPKESLPSELSAKNILLNPTTKKVFRKKKEVKLTLKEFTLLEYLLRNIDRVVSREQILTNVWDFAFDSFANVVDVHITNLRKKLDDKNGELIETVRGVGYRINS